MTHAVVILVKALYGFSFSSHLEGEGELQAFASLSLGNFYMPLW